jgi:hypothetical protein
MLVPCGSSRYLQRRPVVTPRRLADLAGPIHGRIELSPTIAWTRRRTYDLDSPAGLTDGYPGANDPTHAGPYVKISRNGAKQRYPLTGEPHD